MATEVINIASKLDAKGFKQAESASAKLAKNVKSLGKAFGVTFAAVKITQFGKAAATAFIQDEKAAAQLTNTMKNLGLELSAPTMGKFIEQLSLATGVVDDQLRPAMQALLQTTGSVTMSQKLLAQAVDVSASTGYDLTTVSNDLAQAYVGNLKGLRKYNLGLTQAELKASSFADIQKLITERFSGSNRAYLETYAGKMQLLTTAAGEAKEVIGKGLVDALVAVGGEATSVQDTADSMMNLAQAISDISLGFGSLLGKLTNTPIVGDLLKAVGWVLSNTGILGGLRFFGEQERLKKERAAMPSGTVGSALAQGAAMQQKIVEEEALKRARELAKLAAQATAEKKKQLALEKAKANLAKAQANFDITKINLAAALKGKVSKEEELRLLALQAIENENGELALKYISKLDYARQQAADAEEARQKALINSIQARMNVILALQDRVNAKIAGMSVGSMSSQAATVAAYTPLPEEYYQRGGASLAAKNAGLGADNNITIKLDGIAFQNAVVDATNSADIMGTSIIDVHDYASTTKNKTVRTMTGFDSNGAGQITLVSSLWMSTAAITSMSIISSVGSNFTTNSTFALYGIKG